jgi:hypothetical protein
MPHRKALTHEDDLFGRVALHNNMISLNQVVDCARVISAEIVAGRPRRSLAGVLIERGHLTSSQAGAIQAALRRRAAEQGQASRAPAGPTPKPRPMTGRAPAGTSQMLVAVGRGERESDSAAEDPDGKSLAKIVRRIAPGRIYPEMLDYITSHRIGVIKFRDLAAAIEEPADQVLAALRYWKKIGLLREEASHPYCFGPTDEVAEEVRAFLDAWHEQSTHTEVLGLVLACE